MMFAPVKEVDIYGVFLPSLLVWGALSLFSVKIAHRFLAQKNFYRSDIEAQIFDLSLFVVIISLLSFLVP